MTWLDTLYSGLLSIVTSNIARAFLIILLTVCLTWGIRPAIRYLLGRILPAYCELGSTLTQLLVIVGGMSLVVMTAGWGSLAIVAIPIVAFVSGMYIGGQTMLADLLATRQLRARKLYQIGDLVTIGNSYHGVVTEIGRLQTKLDMPGQATVLLRHRLVVRCPVTLHTQHGQIELGAVVQPARLHPVTRDVEHQLVGTQSGTDELLAAELLPQPTTQLPSLAVDENEADGNRDKAARSKQNPPKHSPKNAGAIVIEKEGVVPNGLQAESLEVATNSSTELSLWSKIIMSPVATQLTKRKAMGKSTIQELF